MKTARDFAWIEYWCAFWTIFLSKWPPNGDLRQGTSKYFVIQSMDTPFGAQSWKPVHSSERFNEGLASRLSMEPPFGALE
jgi:hypothetical protein